MSYGAKDLKYGNAMSPAMREKVLKAMNDPDLISVKPEIKILEDVLAKTAADAPERAMFDKQLLSLKKTQAKFDKQNAKSGV